MSKEYPGHDSLLLDDKRLDHVYRRPAAGKRFRVQANAVAEADKFIVDQG